VKRVIFTAPEVLEFDALSEPQQAAINSVVAQWVLPMPGSNTHDGQKLGDALVLDTFDPEIIDQLDLPITVVGVYHWDGETLDTVAPLGAESLVFVGGAQVLPHNWAGWPSI